MNIEHDGDKVVLADLNPFVAQLLRMVPGAGQADASDEAAARFFQQLGADVEANAEWQEFVHPELERLFDSATDTVRDDLKTMQTDAEVDVSALAIPLQHGDAWLNCLNRARLGLAATHRLSEEKLTAELGGAIDSPEELVLFQIHFYAMVQEVLIEALDAEM